MTGLQPPHPNPFNPVTEIRFSLARPAEVQLVIYDVRGRRVKQLLAERRESGSHSVKWLGVDDRGSSVASGVYHLRMEVGAQRYHQRLTLVR